MKNDSNAATLPANNAPEEITCRRCGTSEHLIIEALQALEPEQDGLVFVDYSCGECESFYAHEVSVKCLTEFISRVEAPLGVAEVGKAYVHCGEPMSEGGMKVTGIDDPADDGRILNVLLPTVVLRCRCGFQMSIPR